MLLFNLMDPYVYEYVQQEPFFLHSFFQTVKYVRIGSVNILSSHTK
jgi:hypothetical protein